MFLYKSKTQLNTFQNIRSIFTFATLLGRGGGYTSLCGTDPVREKFIKSPPRIDLLRFFFFTNLLHCQLPNKHKLTFVYFYDICFRFMCSFCRSVSVSHISFINIIIKQSEIYRYNTRLTSDYCTERREAPSTMIWNLK